VLALVGWQGAWRDTALVGYWGCNGSADQIDDSPEILFICRQLRGPKIIERRSTQRDKTIFEVKFFFYTGLFHEIYLAH
jgi:hypothetical protein